MTGRMVARDPVRNEANPYPYSRNNPVNYLDPDGRIPFPPAVAGLFGLGGGLSRAIESVRQQTMGGGKVSLGRVLKDAADGAIRGVGLGLAAVSNPATAALLLAEEVGTLVGKSAYNMATKGRPDFMDAVREAGYVFFGGRPETKYQYPSVAGNTKDSVRPVTKPATAPTVSGRDPKAGCASGYGYTGGYRSAGGHGNAGKSANPFSSLTERWSRNPFTIMDSVVEATMLVGDGISLVKAVGNLIKGKNVLARGREMLSKALGLAKGKGGTRAAAYADDAARVGVKSGSNQPDFYVKPNGETVPSTGYRYMSKNAPYMQNLKESMEIPANPNGTYISFDKYDIPTPGRLQVPHDASIRGSFDTMQIIDDVRIPNGKWGEASWLEPLTKDFPKYGSGGATQAITNQRITLDSLNNLVKER